MKVKCWKCNGTGRLRDEPLTSPSTLFLGVITCGLVPLIRAAVESNSSDDRFWHDCKICSGKGYQSV